MFLRFKIIVIMLFVAVSVLAQTPVTEVQGHRGARALKPENTLPSIEVALDLQVDTIELDMHYTMDGRVVVWHDPAIDSEKCYLPDDNMVDVPETVDSFIFGANPRLIARLTLEQVQAFRCDLNPDSTRFPQQDNLPTVLAEDDYRIPTLREVFVFVDDYANSDLKSEEQRANASGVNFNVETKRQPNRPAAIGDDFDGMNAGAFELAIIDLIVEFDLVDRVVVQSFDHRSIWAVKAENPDIMVSALTSRQRPQFDIYVENDASIWSPNYQQLDKNLVIEAQALGLRVIPWTVNDIVTMQRLIDMGVDGIITDRPDLLIDLLEND